MRVGLYGGSFDPIHVGHIGPVLEAKKRLGLDRVVYLPTAQPPHKPDRLMAPAHARFAMVELALLEHSDLIVSPFELTLEQPSYTVDSVEHFGRQNPTAEIFLIIGGDSFAELPTWHRWLDLVRACRLAVLTRPGWDVSSVMESLPRELLDLLKDGTASFVENPAVDVSSTSLRRLLASGEPIAPELMPPLVVDYVKKYVLYS